MELPKQAAPESLGTLVLSNPGGSELGALRIRAWTSCSWISPAQRLPNKPMVPPRSAVPLAGLRVHGPRSVDVEREEPGCEGIPVRKREGVLQASAIDLPMPP